MRGANIDVRTELEQRRTVLTGIVGGRPAAHLDGALHAGAAHPGAPA